MKLDPPEFRIFKVKLPASVAEDCELIGALTGRLPPAVMREAITEYCELQKTKLLKQAALRKEWGAKGGQPSHKKKESNDGP